MTSGVSVRLWAPASVDHLPMTKPVLVVDGKKMCGRKTCKAANPQPVENFSRSSQTASGLKSRCKECTRIADNRPDVKARSQTRAAEKYRQDGEKDRARAAAWYAGNREKAIERIIAAQKSDRERINARFRAYRAEGRYRHHDRAHAAKRRALLALVPSESINLDDLYERDEGVCQICFGAVDRSVRWPRPLSESLDHYIPITKGGSHTWDNVRLTHLRCNMEKGARLPSL